MGSSKPEADAEILLLTNRLMKAAGLKGYTFKIGHVGVLRGILSQEKLNDKVQNEVLQLMDKKQYDEAFKIAGDSDASERCLAVLRDLVGLKGDSVFGTVEKIKQMVEGYEKAVAAAENLNEILKLVSESGSKIDVNVEAGFARGLEYYTGMIVEVDVPELDVALAGGGRYDRLIELFGGEPTPAVGIAHGIDRIMLAMQEQKAPPETEEQETAMVIPIREESKGEALKISQMLRESGIAVEVEVMGRKIAKALEDADRRKIGYAIIVGERELKEGAVVIRNLKKRKQNTIKIENLAEAISGKTTT
jgi:histidyl-tRNA synthetase